LPDRKQALYLIVQHRRSPSRNHGTADLVIDRGVILGPDSAESTSKPIHELLSRVPKCTVSAFCCAIYEVAKSIEVPLDALGINYPTLVYGPHQGSLFQPSLIMDEPVEDLGFLLPGQRDILGLG
jgi:hypothetical protein